jgi:RNA polymerase sigma-70 factor (ECF subfamily)
MLPEPPIPTGVSADENEPREDQRLVFERFSRRLIGLARGHLGARLQHKVDPEDVVQSAYKSLLLRYGEGALAAEGWEGLWGLLTLITVRKCADRARFHQAERRDLRREAPPPAAEESPLWREALGREPTPDQAVVLAETVEGLLGRLDADERAIIELSLQGFSTQEISQRTGRAERSVRRLRERVRKYLERQQEEAAM